MKNIFILHDQRPPRKPVAPGEKPPEPPVPVYRFRTGYKQPFIACRGPLELRDALGKLAAGPLLNMTIEVFVS